MAPKPEETSKHVLQPDVPDASQEKASASSQPMQFLSPKEQAAAIHRARKAKAGEGDESEEEEDDDEEGEDCECRRVHVYIRGCRFPRA